MRMDVREGSQLDATATTAYTTDPMAMVGLRPYLHERRECMSRWSMWVEACTLINLLLRGSTIFLGVYGLTECRAKWTKEIGRIEKRKSPNLKLSRNT